MRTPCSISFTITAFDSRKASSRRLSHLKGVPGFSRSRNGSIISVMLKAYETWFIRPNHERTSVMFLGVGKSTIAFKYFGHGRTLSGVISKPANSTQS